MKSGSGLCDEIAQHLGEHGMYANFLFVDVVNWKTHFNFF